MPDDTHFAEPSLFPFVEHEDVVVNSDANCLATVKGTPVAVVHNATVLV